MFRIDLGALRLALKPFRLLVLFVLAICGPALSPASVMAAAPQSCTDGTTGVPTGSVVLRGEYLCIGLSNFGTMGVGDSTDPGIRHSPTGDVANKGSYDYLTPGTPYDGFALQANNINGGALLSNTNGGTAAFTGTLTDTSAGSVNSATWTSTSHAAYDITNVYTFSDDQETLKVSVTITAKTDIVNLRYLRSMDPDAQAGPGDSSSTTNALGYGSLPASDFVYTETLGTKVVLSMYSNSAVPHEAKLLPGCCSIVSPDTPSRAAGVGDWGIGIAFYIGDLANGSSVVLDYEYRFAASLAGAAGVSPAIPNIDTTKPGGYTIDDVNAGRVNPTFDGGTLALGSSGTIAAPFSVNASNGTVNTAGNSVTFAGAFTGPGSITKTGAGTMTLAGINTNTGGFAVNAGTLNLATGGSITGAVAVGSGTQFIGNGTVNGATTVTGPGSVLSGAGTFLGGVTINSGATHRPGNSPGTVAVSGAYVLAPGGTLEVEFASNGTSDRINLTGTATLSGNLAIKGYGTGFTGPSYTYLVLDNDLADAINLDFAGVINNSAFYNATYTLVGGTGNDLEVTLTRSAETFRTVALTENQTEVGRVLDALPSARYADLLGLFTPAEVRALLDSLSGEVYASSASMLSENFARNLTGNVTGAIDPFSAGCGFGPGTSDTSQAERANCVVANSFRVLAKGGYRSLAAGNAGATSATIGGIEGQILFPFEFDGGNSHAYLGAVLTHERGGVQTPSVASTATTAANGISAVAGWSQGGLDLTGTFGFSQATVDTTRTYGGMPATGKFDVGTLGGSLGLSYAIDAGNGLTIRPFGAVTHAVTHTGAFSETTASGLAYSGAAGTSSQTLVTLGLGLSSEFVLEGTVVRPRAEASVSHRVAGTPGAMTGTIGGSSPFTTIGANSGDTTLKLGVGATFLKGDGLSIDADYRVEASGAAIAHSATIAMKVSF